MERLKTKDLAAWRQWRLEYQGGIDPIAGIKITVPCADHHHETGRLRQVLQREVNAFEGKVFNAWRRYLRHLGVPLTNAISGLLAYYDVDYSKNPLHPSHRSAEEKKTLRNKRAKRRRKLKKKGTQ